jgi:hypothetical protein
MYKIVIHRPNGELLVIPHSSQDMPTDGFTIAKCLTLELAEMIVKSIYEFLDGNNIMVILNPVWMVHRNVEICTIHLVPAFDPHDVQLSTNAANLSTEVHDGDGALERVVQVIWPRINHTFEAVHLMIAPGPRPVPVADLWASAA